VAEDGIDGVLVLFLIPRVPDRVAAEALHVGGVVDADQDGFQPPLTVRGNQAVHGLEDGAQRGLDILPPGRRDA